MWLKWEEWKCEQNFSVETSWDTEKEACTKQKNYFYEMVSKDEKWAEAT
jgi:hypothetical protein